MKPGSKCRTAAARMMVAILAVAMMITMMPFAGDGYSYAAESSLDLKRPVVLVSGSAVLGGTEYSKENVGLEKSYTLEELKGLEGGTNVQYSAVKTQTPYTRLLYRANGVYLKSLLDGTQFNADTDVLKVSSNEANPWIITFDPSRTETDRLDLTGLSTQRFFFSDVLDHDPENPAEPAAVEPMLAWASKNSSAEDPGDAGSDKDYLTLMVGQLSVDDQNNAAYGKYMTYVTGGDPVEEVVLTIGSTSYTRADLLMMDFAERDYTYTKSSGEDVTDHARGVPLASLLEGKSDDAVVTFHAADDYAVEADGLTVKELADSNYILAYEVNGAGVFGTKKGDASKRGFLTLYGDGSKPFKMIDMVTATETDPDHIDFDSSIYKHTNNGGIQGATGPYNIDSITSATLTIEGPGMTKSVPLSVRDFETRKSGYERGVYTDTRDGKETARTYEGMDLYHLLHNMTSGSNGIVMTDNAYQVSVRNRNRKEIASFTLADIEKAHNDGRPILAAYGTAFEDGSSPAPFVFDGAAGIIDGLGNDDGCLKLVYDLSAYDGHNPNYTEFGNMAYVYVEEAASPGYKHTAEGSKYNTPANTQHIISITGDKLGREVNYTIEDIENLVEYDADGNIVDNGFGYKDSYSLTNTSYWYINEYEGVKLWSLLLNSGLDASLASDDETKVNYLTTDNYAGTDKFTLKQIADDDSFGFYEKNALDNGDGYESDELIRDDEHPERDKIAVGYPVLLAYGVNGYPYVINSNSDGYLSGLSNDGGPVRVISGKTKYRHNNGSNQAQRLSGIVVGSNNYHYATHKYHSDEIYTAIADNELKVSINAGGKADERTYTIGDLEDIVYDGTRTQAQLARAMVKAKYSNGKNTDLYEGVSLRYFLQEYVELSGAEGTITFTGSDGKTLSASLAEILNMDDGINADTGVGGLVPIIAYGKNGYPLVNSNNAAPNGYVSSETLAAGTEFEHSIDIKNKNGPLQVMIPATPDGEAAKVLSDLASIQIDLEPDAFAHIAPPYDAYADNEITFSGAGTNLTEPKTFKVSELEGKQLLAGTYDYSIVNKSGKQSNVRYRGIRLYDFLKSANIGLKTNADKVIVTSSDGASAEFSIKDVMKTSYINTVDESVTELPVILAYGSADAANEDKKDGKPLVASKEAEGYDAAYSNSGGPVKFMIGQTDAEDVNSNKCISDVVSIEVTAGEITNWNHSSSDVFSSYLDDVITFEAIGSENNVIFTKDLTVKELESMTDLVDRAVIHLEDDNEWEGLNLYGLLMTVMKDVKGIENPTSIQTISIDGWSFDLMEKGLDTLRDGVKDGETYKPVMLAYGFDGVPLAAKGKNAVLDPEGPGYDSLLKNGNGPMRVVIHNEKGKSGGHIVKIQVKVSGGGAEPEVTEFDTYAGTGQEGALPMAGLRATAIDKDGGLWVGTYGGGAAYKAKGSDTFTVYNLASEPALNSATIPAICPDADGGVYMSQVQGYSGGSGVAYMKDGKVSYLTKEDGRLPSDYVQEIRIDKDGIVWFGSDVGLTRYDPKTEESQSWGMADGFPADSIDNIEFDADGGIWCGFYPESEAGDGSKPFSGGFAYFKDGKVVKSYVYTSDQDSETGQYRLGDVWVRDIAVDKNGGAWIVASGSYGGMANTGGRVYYVSKPGDEASVYTGFDLFGADAFTQDSELRMVTVDPDGGLWLGTSKDGVFYVKDPAVKDGKLTLTEKYSSASGSWSSASMDNVYSLDFHGNTLYAGSSGGLATHEFTFSGGSDEPEVTAEEVISAIDEIAGISDISVSDRETIRAARAAYDSLTPEEQAKVTNLDKLEAAEAALDEAIKTDSTEKGEALISDIDYTDYSASAGMGLWLNLNKLQSKLEKAETGEEAEAILRQIEEAVANTMTLEEETLADLNEFPIEVKASSAGYNKISLKWSKVPKAGGYVVYRSDTADGEYKELKAVPEEIFTDTGLETGRKYFYKVAARSRAKSDYVFGEQSKAASAAPALGRTKVTLKAGKKKATVKWNKVSGASGYEIYRSTKKSGGFKKVKTVSKGTTVKLINKKLKAKKTYYYKIRAYRTVDGKKVYGAYSPVKSVKIKK